MPLLWVLFLPVALGLPSCAPLCDAPPNAVGTDSLHVGTGVLPGVVQPTTVALFYRVSLPIGHGTHLPVAVSVPYSPFVLISFNGDDVCGLWSPLRTPSLVLFWIMGP